MNKSDLITYIADEADISKAAAAQALNAVTGAITKTLKKGDTVALIGFGTFSVSKRKAREGRNPQTGEAIKIAACKVARFSPGKGLKDALN